MTHAVSYLNTIPLAGITLVVALGFLLGRASWRGMSLGPSGGALIVAIVAGRLGLDLHSLYATEDPLITLGGFGFALFIYSVGFEAGPQFLAGVRGGLGWRFGLIGLTVNLLAVGVAIAGAKIFSLGTSVTAGLLAGALTSAPAYAAASEVAPDPAALAVSFAITYPLGLVGLVLLVQFLPRLMGDDLAEGTEAEEAEHQPLSDRPILHRVFLVSNEEVLGLSLGELDLSHRSGCVITRMSRANEVRVPDAETRLEKGDHVMAKGRLEQLQSFHGIVGPEVYDDDLRHSLPSPRAVQISSRGVIGKSLQELALVSRFHCLVTEVLRAGVVIDPTADLELRRDDVVMVTGRRDDVRALARELGRFERSSQETDIAIYAGGILLGTLLGQLHLRGLGLDFRVGQAVGLLIVGVALGRVGRLGPFSAQVPVAARQLVRDLGILLFIAETGVAAGGAPFSAVGEVLGAVLFLGAMTLLIPVLGAVIIGRRILDMRPADNWGAIGGGMTSSAALVAVRNAADSNEPAISYAAAYAVGSVVSTLAGRLVVLAM